MININEIEIPMTIFFCFFIPSKFIIKEYWENN